MMLGLFVLCCVAVNLVSAGTYKAAVSDVNVDSVGLLSLVYEAGKKNVDIMVLPRGVTDSEDYDENVKTLSSAAKQAGLYLVAHLQERTRCQNKMELIRSNLVFDRDGAIVKIKSQNNIANCTVSSPGLVTFATDFGVTFGLMMEEDLVLSDDLQGLKNFVVSGGWSSDIPYFSAPQFSAPWSHTHKANLVSPHGIYAGEAGVKTGPGKLKIAHLKKTCEEETSSPPIIDAATIKKSPEDLSQYIIRPLDLVAGARGHSETVCHNKFCCEFNFKIRSEGQDEASYGLAAFNGIRHLGGSQYIGSENCAVFACAGLYKRSCSFGSANNNTNIVFEKLSITANFTNEKVYPVVLSNQELSSKQFEISSKSDSSMNTVEMTVTNSDSLLTFGIFGRTFENDYKSLTTVEDSVDFYNYIFTEDVQEFFDYLWIRVRILLFIVSIYILEMM